MDELTKIHITEEQKYSALLSAYRMTMSDHEWTWTQKEQQDMATMILWQSTIISKLKHVREASQKLYNRVPTSALLKPWWIELETALKDYE